jgi:hypothetical protein
MCIEHLQLDDGALFDTVLRGVGQVVVCTLRFFLCLDFIRFLASLGAMVSTPNEFIE